MKKRRCKDFVTVALRLILKRFLWVIISIVLFVQPNNANDNNEVFQTIEISGKVTDGSNMPLPGVNVIEKGTTNGAVTDLDGKYSLNVSSTNAVLTFSFIGFLSEDIQVSGKTTIDVILVEDIKTLEEVVVVGYGTARRKDLTGSIATIGGEELKKVPVTNVAEALKGKMPGVNVTTTDGSPDAEIVIRVRGGGSITQDNSPLYVVDGFIVNSIRDIPSSDITSITVLKDAAATAIYGAQAANGVILVTTRNPEAGKTTVNYNGYMQSKKLPEDRRYDMLDPYEYVFANYEYYKLTNNLNSFQKFFGKYEDLELYKAMRPTDWQEEVFGNNQLSQSHNLSITGGTEKTKMSLSLTNNQDEAIMVGNGYQRNSINFKLNHNISDKINFDATLRITDTRVDGVGTSGGSQISVRHIVKSRPVNGIADELEFDLSSADEDDYQTFLQSLVNPVELAEQNWRKKTDLNYVYQAALSWKPINSLTLKSAFTNSRGYNEQQRFYGPLTYESTQNGSSLPLGEKYNILSTSYRLLNTANYVMEKSVHNLEILVGNEIYSIGGSRSFVRAEEFRESITPEEMFANMQLGENLETYETGLSTEQNRLSFFGRANYQLMGKYMVTATLRSDASSKFLKENRLGIFPAFAVGWKINEERFMKNVPFINELKLRASYGQTGNDRITATATQFLFNVTTQSGPGMGTNDFNGYYTPTDASVLPNPELVWETTVNANVGLDFILFNGSIRGNFDVYKNTTENLLLKSAYPPASGFNYKWQNIGSTSNEGIELALSTAIIEKNDFRILANVNFGINRAKIVELDGTNERFYQSNWASTDLADRDDYYLEVGRTVGLMYGYVSDGMYTVDDFESYDETLGTYTLKDGIPDNSKTLGVGSLRPGFMKLKDISGPDGVPDGEINSMDRRVIGSGLPDASGGFGLEAYIKGFDASVFFNWSIGNDIYNTGKINYNQLYRSTYGNMTTAMSSDKRFTYIDVDGSYTGTAGEVVTDLEQLREMNANKSIWSGNASFSPYSVVVSDWAIEDGSFLRLNNVTLGYTLPESLTSKVKIARLRIYASGYNLWVWTKYSGFDPEVSTSRSSAYSALIQGIDYSSYPRSRAFTFGINITL